MVWSDVFFVRGGPFETMHFRVYNGWGELLFETEDPEFGWDGTHDGKPEDQWGIRLLRDRHHDRWNTTRPFR